MIPHDQWQLDNSLDHQCENAIHAINDALRATVTRAWRLTLWVGEMPDFNVTVPLLRGIWGKELHRLGPETYERIFVGEPSPFGRIPRYIIRPVGQDDEFVHIDFILFGWADSVTDNDVWAAWQNAADTGLGPWDDRRRVLLCPPAPLAWDGTVLAPGGNPGFSLEGLATLETSRAPGSLQFTTPLRLLRRQVLIEQPTLADIITAAIRRLASLSPAAAERLWHDRHWWIEQARHIPALPWRGIRCDVHRYSASQQTDLELRGVTGSLILPAGPGPLAPLLSAASWLHLGKSTCLGLGSLTWTPAEAH